MLVRDFQSVIGREARAQCLAQNGPGRLGGVRRRWPNAIGLFHPFLGDAGCHVWRRGGRKGSNTGAHAAPLSAGTPGVLHGNRTYLMQDEDEISDILFLRARLPWCGAGIHGSKYWPGPVRRSKR